MSNEAQRDADWWREQREVVAYCERLERSRRSNARAGAREVRADLEREAAQRADDAEAALRRSVARLKREGTR